MRPHSGATSRAHLVTLAKAHPADAVRVSPAPVVTHYSPPPPTWRESLPPPRLKVPAPPSTAEPRVASVRDVAVLRQTPVEWTAATRSVRWGPHRPESPERPPQAPTNSTAAARPVPQWGEF